MFRLSYHTGSNGSPTIIFLTHCSNLYSNILVVTRKLLKILDLNKNIYFILIISERTYYKKSQNITYYDASRISYYCL